MLSSSPPLLLQVREGTKILIEPVVEQCRSGIILIYEL